MNPNEQPELSRRAFLGEPLKRFRNVFTELSSEHSGKDPDKEIINSAIEKVGEMASFITLVWVASKGAQDQLVSYGVDSESKIKDTPEFEEATRSFNDLTIIVAPTADQARKLNDAWTNAYQDTVCVPVISTDSSGNTTTSVDCQTEWNEPFQITSKGVDRFKIGDWDNFLNSVREKINLTGSKASEAFDLSNGDSSLFYKEKAADKGNQLVIATAAYGLLGGLFAYYEEILNEVTRDSWTGKGGVVEDKKYIKRRTLFKVGAALLVALKAREFQRAFASENKDLLAEIKENTKSVLSQMDIPAEENFKRFFGTDPKGLREKIADVEKKCSNALNSGYNGGLFGSSEWNRVKPELEKMRDQSSNSLQSFDSYFTYNAGSGAYIIPEELTRTTKNLWATNEIVGFVNSKSTQINTRHLKDAAIVAFSLAGMSIVTEKLLFPLSERVLQEKRETTELRTNSEAYPF